MRVTGGIMKGQQLKIPKDCAIRPTTDMVREATFSMLTFLDNPWSRVLDLYAGSGALGIEALSRSVEFVDFVDQEPRCCAIIKQNLDKLGLSGKAHVYCYGVPRALTSLEGIYDIIFADPPYSDTSITNVVTQLASSKLINEESLVVVFHASRFPLDSSYDGLYLVKCRRYGDTSVSIYQKRILEKN